MILADIPIPKEYSKLLVAATCHLGGQSLTNKMTAYAFERRNDKVWVLNLQKTWEKLVLSAQIIASYKNRSDIVVVSSKTFGNKPVTMFAREIGATSLTGKLIAGSFTNRKTKAVKEPRLLIITDPFTDGQIILEASYINVPCIGLANTDNETNLIDCVIPCNNRSPNSIGAIYFILAQLVRYISGEITLEEDIRIKVDAYFYRDPAEIEAAMAEKEKEGEKSDDEDTEEPYNEQEWEEAEAAKEEVPEAGEEWQ